MKLANVKNQEYTKEMFKDIAIFTLAEPGAMAVSYTHLTLPTTPYV